MFKNKSIQVKVVDTKNLIPDPNAETTPSVDYVQLVRETTETVAKHLVIGVGVYVAVDTLRQVLVKLTPTN